MHFQLSSLVSGLTLAAFLAQPVLSVSVHQQPAHKHSLRSNDNLHVRYAHAHLHRRRFARDGVARRDAATSQLQTEITGFSNWMNSFFASSTAFNTQDAVSKVQDEMKVHGDAMDAFVLAAKSNSAISAGSIDQLQMEIDSFKAWANAWAQTATVTDSDAAMNVLKQDVTSYESWLNQWISANSGSSAGSVQPSAAAPSEQASPAPVPVPAPAPAPAPAAPAPAPVASEGASKSQSDTGSEYHHKPQPVPSYPQPDTSSSSAAPEQPSETPAAPAYSPPAAAPAPAPAPAPAAPAPAPAATSEAAQPSSQPVSSPAPSDGGFNAGGSTNLAAWWGQTAAASEVGLQQLCDEESYNIIILCFVNGFFGPGGMPTLNFGPASGSPSAAQTAAGATGLFDASHLAPIVQSCQAKGKKVMISMGGAIAQSTFSNDQEGQAFADTMWNLFLGGSSELRPFGDVQLDGIDIDNESHDQTGYTAFTSALRQKISSSQRPYYISAAPQCPRPDASVPLDAMHQMDFVWVQFYNNGDCNHGASGFIESVKNWSSDLSAGSAKLYVAAIADPSQGTGFIDADALKTEMESVKALGLSNFGGYALWDGSYAVKNGAMMTSVKEAMTSLVL